MNTVIMKFKVTQSRKNKMTVGDLKTQTAWLVETIQGIEPMTAEVEILESGMQKTIYGDPQEQTVIGVKAKLQNNVNTATLYLALSDMFRTNAIEFEL